MPRAEQNGRHRARISLSQPQTLRSQCVSGGAPLQASRRARAPRRCEWAPTAAAERPCAGRPAAAPDAAGRGLTKSVSRQTASQMRPGAESPNAAERACACACMRARTCPCAGCQREHVALVLSNARARTHVQVRTSVCTRVSARECACTRAGAFAFACACHLEVLAEEPAVNRLLLERVAVLAQVHLAQPSQHAVDGALRECDQLLPIRRRAHTLRTAAISPRRARTRTRTRPGISTGIVTLKRLASGANSRTCAAARAGLRLHAGDCALGTLPSTSKPAVDVATAAVLPLLPTRCPRAVSIWRPPCVSLPLPLRVA
eukprot:5416864-Pleurochrysis_carterae.AAC.1